MNATPSNNPVILEPKRYLPSDSMDSGIEGLELGPDIYAPSSPTLERDGWRNRKVASQVFQGDSVSIINGSTVGHREMTTEEKNQMFWKNLTVMLSCIYAVFLITLGGIVFIFDHSLDQHEFSEIFSCVISALGIAWLSFLHIDLHRYKSKVMKEMKQREDDVLENADKISTNTEFIINSGLMEEENPPYRFLTGRHSGSFYLKVGMAAFCFGHLLHEGLLLGQLVLNFMEDSKYCDADKSALVVHVIRPIYSFYQLFITFKYSNVIINRFKGLATFGLMHIMATCICFWFGTIVMEAFEDYKHDDEEYSHHNGSNGNLTNETFPTECNLESVLSIRSINAVPYLYPFTIEYNLLLAGVWFIVWQNIGQENEHAKPHHFQHKISNNEEITYQSNLVISADCHASNKGLFTGLFLLLSTIVTVIVFYVAMSTDDHKYLAIQIQAFQEAVLNILALISVSLAYYQISRLEINLHPITFLDDVLLFIPLPFFFVNAILSIVAEVEAGDYYRVALHLLNTLQVTIQTPFIIDGLRRCSNMHSLRYKKPGRELITFLIILNLTMWIVNTFELKSVEHYLSPHDYFGGLNWMLIGHTTLPLMLFYRFHASVCLADIWKSAYEKE